MTADLALEDTRICRLCVVDKPISDFNKNGHTCKQCIEDNKRTSRKRRSLLKVGWTEYEYYEAYDNQRGRCAICHTETTWDDRGLAADHDHITGKRRELLCPRCNLTLGAVDDDPILLEKMASYIRKHRQQHE